MKMFFRTGFRGLVVAGVFGSSWAAAGEAILVDTSDLNTSTILTTVPRTIGGQSLNSPYNASDSTFTTDGNSTNRSDSIFGFTNTHLNITTDQVRNGSQFNYSDFTGTVRFQVAEDTTYSLAGSFEVTDTDKNNPGHTFFSAKLLDETNPGVPPALFSQVQSSDSVDAHFALTNSLSPPDSSLTGVLLKDHIYVFDIQADIQARYGPDKGAEASGYFSLGIGADPFDPRTVSTPEPGVVWAGSALLSMLGARRLLSRRKALVTKA